MDAQTIGTIGILLIALGWSRQAYNTLKTRKSGLRLKFSGLYLAGSALLVYYAASIGDFFFAALNTLAAAMAAIEFYVRARQEKVF